jgi:hypothetical protein
VEGGGEIFFENFLMRMIGRERMALAGPKALNFCTGQLRAGRGDAPRVAVSASTDECAAATPRRGPTDGVM